MPVDIEEIKRKIKQKRANIIGNSSNDEKRSKYISFLFARVLCTIILILGSVIFIKTSNKNLLMYKEQVFTKNLSFAKVNNWWHKNFGNIIPIDDIVKDPSEPVWNEKFVYKNLEKYLDGAKLNVGKEYLVPAINSGIIVFMGEKEGYGSTIIIQGIDGVDIWYGNVEATNLTLYDYIEKGSLIAKSKEEDMYLVLQKDGTYLNYEDYQK